MDGAVPQWTWTTVVCWERPASHLWAIWMSTDLQTPFKVCILNCLIISSHRSKGESSIPALRVGFLRTGVNFEGDGRRADGGMPDEGDIYGNLWWNFGPRKNYYPAGKKKVRRLIALFHAHFAEITSFAENDSTCTKKKTGQTSLGTTRRWWSNLLKPEIYKADCSMGLTEN